MNLETEVSRELWQAVQRSYGSQAWSNAILDSVHYLSDALRTKTDLKSDGTALVGQALGGKAPKLKLNRLQTESEQNVQAGVEQLLRGLYQAVRNPRSHERIEDNQADADALILFVDYLLRVIGHARSAFSIDECVGHILEEGFVPNERYAELIAEEIPTRQRLQVALTVYQRKSEGAGQRLRYFFNAIAPKLTEEELGELFHAVSTDLRESHDEDSLQCVLQALDPKYWPQIEEAARLRTENRIIRNLRDGRYLRKTGKCQGGALATWSRGLWPHFTLKQETMLTLVEKLRSTSIESQDYVLMYCFSSLDALADTPPPSLQRVLTDRLVAGDVRFKEAIEASSLWFDWDEPLKKAIASFQPSNPVPDEDIPF